MWDRMPPLTLWQDRQPRSQCRQGQLGDIQAVDDYLPLLLEQEAEKRKGEGRFAGTGSSADTDLLLRVDREANASQYRVELSLACNLAV